MPPTVPVSEAIATRHYCRCRNPSQFRTEVRQRSRQLFLGPPPGVSWVPATAQGQAMVLGVKRRTPLTCEGLRQEQEGVKPVRPPGPSSLLGVGLDASLWGRGGNGPSSSWCTASWSHLANLDHGPGQSGRPRTWRPTARHGGGFSREGLFPRRTAGSADNCVGHRRMAHATCPVLRGSAFPLRPLGPPSLTVLVPLTGLAQLHGPAE